MPLTMTELCLHLKNWFNRKPNGEDLPKLTGTFTIQNGKLQSDKIAEGQYFWILGSIFNEGVHNTDETLTDEIFDGAVWLMAVPAEVTNLFDEINAWQAKYGGIDSAAMSPYNSESFGGYSYSKSGGGASSGGASGGAGTWQSVFASRLNVWRKI